MEMYDENGKPYYNYLAMTELQDILEELYESLPSDKRTKEFQKAKKEYNDIVLIYNTKAKTKIYNKIK